MKFRLNTYETTYTEPTTEQFDTCADALHAVSELVAEIMSADLRDLIKNGNDVDFDVRVRTEYVTDDHDDPKSIKFLMTDYISSRKPFDLATITRVD